MRHLGLVTTLGLLLILVIGGAAWLLFGEDQDTAKARKEAEAKNRTITANGADRSGEVAGRRDRRPPNLEKNEGEDKAPEVRNGGSSVLPPDQSGKSDTGLKPSTNGGNPNSTAEGKAEPITSELTPEEQEWLELDSVPVIPGGAAVYGRVTMPDGTPAKDVRVYAVLVTSFGSNSVAMARTEADGMYAIGNPELLAGGEGINTKGSGYTPTQLQPGRYSIEARVRGAAMTSSEAELGKRLVRRDLKLEPDRVVTITLECVASNGQGVTLPQVTITQRDGGYGGLNTSRFSTSGVSQGTSAPLREGESRTGNTGTPVRGQPNVFTIAVKAMRDVELKFVVPGFRCTDPPGGVKRLDLSDGSDMRLRLMLEPLEAGRIYEDPDGGGMLPPLPEGEARIRGLVILHFQNALLSETSVALEKAGFRTRQMKVDGHGEFAFDKLTEGEYTLRLSNGNFSSTQTRTLTIGPRGEEYLEWELKQSVISFSFEEQGASPVGKILRLNSDLKRDDRAMKYSQISDFNEYRNIRVTAGLYWVEVSGSDAIIATADADGSYYFEVDNEGKTVEVPLPIVKPGTVTYQIMDSQGYGWTGAEVRLVREEWFQAEIQPARTAGEPVDWQRARLGGTDSMGQGKLERLPPGNYRLLIWTRSRDPNRWDRQVPVSVTSGATTDAGRLGSR